LSIEAGVEGIEVSKYGTGHHVGQLNAHAEMGWSDEKPLNQVAESRRTLPIADQEPMVKLPEPLIVVWSSMVADDDSVDPLPDRPLKILRVMLKPCPSAKASPVRRRSGLRTIADGMPTYGY
jgi:hypothetical protein